MLNIGLTKLKLDDAVGGEEITLDGEAGSKDDKTAKEVRKSLLTTLRNKFDAGAVPSGNGNGATAEAEKGLESVLEETPVKIARAAGKKDEM